MTKMRKKFTHLGDPILINSERVCMYEISVGFTI